MKKRKKVMVMVLSFVLLWNLIPNVFAYSVTVEDQIVWRNSQYLEYDGGWYGDVFLLCGEGVPDNAYNGVNIVDDNNVAYHNVYYTGGHKYFYSYACGEYGAMEGKMTVYSPFCSAISNGSGDVADAGAVAEASGIWTAPYTGKGKIEARITGGWTSDRPRAQLYYCDVVDLTAAFGAGNEPSVDFCIQNMKAMSGTKSVYAPDNTPPIITSVYVPPEWTNTMKNITINAYDSETGISSYAVEGMRNWQASPTFQMQAGTFTALVQNGEYNQVARMLFTVNRIDVSPPTISAINGNPGSWVNTDVTLTINAQDTECGLAAAPYSFDNGATWQSSQSQAFQNNTSVSIRVRDALLNTSGAVPVTISKIDKIVPIASISGDGGGWTNKDVVLNITANDVSSGLAAAPYSFDNGATWQSSQSKAFSVNTDNIIAKIRDSAGNITALAPVAINRIDKKIPSITNIYFLKRKETLTKSIMTMFNKQVDIELIAHDIGGSAISKIEYQLVPEGSAEDSAGWLVYDNAARPIIERRFNGKIHARCIDTAGNVSDVLSSDIIVEDTPPTAAHKLNTESWTNSDVTISIAAQDDLSGVHHIVLPNGQEVSAAAADYIVADNGTYAFSVFDNSGNEFKYPVAVSNIDKTSPTQPKTKAFANAFFANGRSVFSWTNKAMTLEFASSAPSGICAYEYKCKNNDWQPILENSLTVKDEGINVVEIRSLSNAGNISSVTTFEIKNDYTSPTVKLSENQGVINISAKDELSGIQEILLPNGELIENPENSATIDYPAAVPEEYAFIVKDTAGNESEVSINVEPADVKPDSSSHLEMPNRNDEEKPVNDTANSTNKLAPIVAAAAATAVGSAGGIGILFLLIYTFANAVVYDMHGRKLGAVYIKKGNLYLDKIKGINDTQVNIKIKKSYVRRHLCTFVKVYHEQSLVGVITLGIERQATENTVNL